ncbi:MAG: UDP-glucose 4-epimerase GalE [Gammaproteobacteria bacterium]|nr:UDP-glucose 4-epimerase GalE [Gammaproteobacteria bacterium]
MLSHILVTGGAGYIGSHTCLELLNAGYRVSVVDNLSNSKFESLNRVHKLSSADQKIDFFECDILDEQKMTEIFQQQKPDAVIHFAGLKAVGESVEIPLDYYQNNIAGTITLLRIMKTCNVKNFVFSSSATVYGDPASVPILENFPTSVNNPYGRSKLYIEEICADIFKSDDSWNMAMLRYFNPVGAHKSGEIGEDPNGIPNNLLPYISQVAIGKREKLSVFGNDYPTSDGTGVRDYIHVVDLAIGHIKALEKLSQNPGLVTYNLGTGKGYSVLEMLHAFEKACGHKIAYQIVDRRAGDIAECYADPSFAKKEINWQATHDLEQMMRDAWNWQSKNPDGYN